MQPLDKLVMYHLVLLIKLLTEDRSGEEVTAADRAVGQAAGHLVEVAFLIDWANLLVMAN